MIKSAFFITIAKYGSSFIQFFLRIILTRVFGVEEYGKLISSINLISLFSKISFFGSLTQIQKTAASKAPIPFIYLAIPIINVIIITPVLIFFVKPWLPFLLLLFFLIPLSFISVYLVSIENVNKIVFISVVPSFIGLVFFYILNVTEWNISYNGMVYIYVTLIYGIPSFYGILKMLDVEWNMTRKSYISTMIENKNYFVSNALSYFNYRSIIILAPFLISSKMTSVIALYHAFLELICGITGTISSLLLNRFSANNKNIDKEKLFRIGIYSVLIITTFSSFVFYKFSELIITTFASSEFYLPGIINFYIFSSIFISTNKIIESKFYSVGITRPMITARLLFIVLFLLLITLFYESGLNVIHMLSFYIISYSLTTVYLFWCMKNEKKYHNNL